MVYEKSPCNWVVFHPLYGGFLKWWYPTTMGFPTKNDHFWVFWGYHHLGKHPYTANNQWFFTSCDPQLVFQWHLRHIHILRKPRFRDIGG